jgi:hypothetical protein
LTPKHGSDRDQKLTDPDMYFKILYFYRLKSLFRIYFI